MPTKLNGNEQETKAEAFNYDPVGNRLTGPETKDTYLYNLGKNQLTTDKKAGYEYDKNGNLIKKTKTDDGETKTWTYSYDFENRLVKVVKTGNPTGQRPLRSSTTRSADASKRKVEEGRRRQDRDKDLHLCLRQRGRDHQSI